MTRAERKLHKRKLSATEKIVKIHELRDAGKTQQETADLLGICRRTVATHWKTTTAVSKQELLRKPAKVKAPKKHKPTSKCQCCNNDTRGKHGLCKDCAHIIAHLVKTKDLIPSYLSIVAIVGM